MSLEELLRGKRDVVIADKCRQENNVNSCCVLRDVATEFSCPGLELDFPIICWGNDFTWTGEWKSPPAKRSKAKDPHRLRVNNYRVLLTRGRDGFMIYVPNEIGMESTYAALVGAGVREIGMENDGISRNIEDSVRVQ